MPETGEQVEQPISVLSEIGLPYVWIPYLILDIYGPAMKEKGWLYTILTRFKNSKDSKTFVGVRTLADACGIHRDTVQEWARHLQNIGLIKITPGDHSRPTEYVLLMPQMPPPPEILEDHYPKDWTPPKRALKALENIRYLMSEYSAPQSMGLSEGGVLNGRTGVPTSRTDRPKPAPTPSQPVGHNNTLNKSLRKTNKQEEDPFVRSCLEMFQKKSPETTYERIEEVYYKSLNLSVDDDDLGKARLQNAIKVVLQSKDTKDPEGLLWKAVEENWRPRPEGAKGKSTEDVKKEKAEDEAKRQKQIDEEFKQRCLVATVEEILSTHEFVSKFDKKTNPIEHLKKTYQGNPNLEKALEILIKAGDKNGA